MNSFIKDTLFSGFVWIAIQTIGKKIISLVFQLILAWILLPEDFGKVSIVFAITGIIFIIQNFGMSDVLINRGRMFHYIFNLAKTMSLTAACICLLFTLFAAYFSELIYEDVEIKYLILISAISIPFSAMTVVADAKLKINLKFKELSQIYLIEFFITQFGIILLVILDFGIYSFVIAPLGGIVFKYFWLHKLAKIDHFFKITFHHWRYLFSNSSYNFIHSFLQTVIRQSDNLILALFVTQVEVGIYFMAYSLSVQVIGFLINSIGPVLFPSLMKIDSSDVTQIKKVLLKLTLIFIMLGMPFAFWQASIIKPFILLFLEEKWYDSIQLIQILSLGIGFNVVASLWGPALRVKTQFKKQMKYSLICAIFFITLITPFSYEYGSKGLAISVSLYYFITSPFLLYYSFKIYGVSLIEVLKPIFIGFIFTGFVFGPVFIFTEYYNLNLYMTLFLNGLLAPGIYFTLCYYKEPIFKEFMNDLKYKINF